MAGRSKKKKAVTRGTTSIQARNLSTILLGTVSYFSKPAFWNCP
jgi:hypothetical protein